MFLIAVGWQGRSGEMNKAARQGRDGGQPRLRRGDRGEAVKALQRALGIHPAGVFGPQTEAALRTRQRLLGLRPDGVAGPKTWAALIGKAEPSSSSMGAGQNWSLGIRGAALIKAFESCGHPVGDGTFKAYPDPGSKDGEPWTIGWGSTGPDVRRGTVWTQEQCDARFEHEIRRYVAEVAKAIGDARTTQNQFDALVSFHYNTGAIAKASLTRCHLAGDYAGAKRGFALWNKNDGKVMRGLVRRRRAEADLYGTP
jgi:GH24 family phage-related lysozyme (muramidase)